MKYSRIVCLLMPLLLPAMAGSAMAADTVVVVIKKMKFQPQQVTVKKGSTVRWENRERRQYHSVWFKQLGEPEPVDYFFPEEIYERRFDAKGEFPYRCGPHEEMTGIVRVID